jgi:D-aminopeptidase
MILLVWLLGFWANEDVLFSAVSDVVEEAIYNALCSAESVVGLQGRRIDAIDLDWLREVLKKHAVFDW